MFLFHLQQSESEIGRYGIYGTRRVSDCFISFHKTGIFLAALNLLLPPPPPPKKKKKKKKKKNHKIEWRPLSVCQSLFLYYYFFLNEVLVKCSVHNYESSALKMKTHGCNCCTERNAKKFIMNIPNCFTSPVLDIVF